MIRTGNRAVDTSVPDSAVPRQGTPMILNRIASSGRILARATERLAKVDIRPPVCIAGQAVFAGTAYDGILRLRAAETITADSTPHPRHAIHIGALLVTAASQIVANLDLPVTGRIRSGANQTTATKGQVNE